MTSSLETTAAGSSTGPTLLLVETNAGSLKPTLPFLFSPLFSGSYPRSSDSFGFVSVSAVLPEPMLPMLGAIVGTAAAASKPTRL